MIHFHITNLIECTQDKQLDRFTNRKPQLQTQLIKASNCMSSTNRNPSCMWQEVRGQLCHGTKCSLHNAVSPNVTYNALSWHPLIITNCVAGTVLLRNATMSNLHIQSHCNILTMQQGKDLTTLAFHQTPLSRSSNSSHFKCIPLNQANTYCDFSKHFLCTSRTSTITAICSSIPSISLSLAPPLN